MVMGEREKGVVLRQGVWPTSPVVTGEREKEDRGALARRTSK